MDFDIIGLKPGSSYTITMKSTTKKFGTIEPVYVLVVTPMEHIKQLAETKVKENKEEESEKIAMVLGGIATVILLVVVILLIVFTHRRRLLERSLPPTHRGVQIETKRAPDKVHESGLYFV